MNKLSQLLYWADVFGGLSVVAGLLAVACLSGSVVFLGISANYRGEEDERIADKRRYRENQDKDLSPDYTFVNKMRDIFRTCLFFFVLLVCVFVFTPTRNTMYAIAASEMGEQALHTPTATKAFQALDAWLDKQIGTVAVPAAN